MFNHTEENHSEEKEMKITVTLFGRYKELAGSQTIQLDLKTDSTLGDVIDLFVKHYPTVDKDKKRILATINKTHASYDTVIDQGDDIALAPPVVSGG